MGDPIIAWSAGVWLSTTRSPSNPSEWPNDSSIPATAWCPGEPNNKGGVEACSGLVTACVQQGGSALVNDYDCSQRLRVVCAFDAPSECPAGRSETACARMATHPALGDDCRRLICR